MAADCAILFSWPNWWAVEQIGQPSAELRMLEQVRWMYRPLFEAGVTADFAAPDEDLSGYPVVLVPSLYLLTEAEGANLRRYVENGGTAVISFWSGIVDEHDRVHLGPYGGPLRELIGGDVVDVAPLQPDQAVEVAWADGQRPAGSLSSGTSLSFGTLWQDLIEATDGEVLARYDGGPWAGYPAVLSKQAGAGRAIYVGTRLDTGALGGPARPGARRALDRQRDSARGRGRAGGAADGRGELRVPDQPRGAGRVGTAGRCGAGPAVRRRGQRPAGAAAPGRGHRAPGKLSAQRAGPRPVWPGARVTQRTS